MRKLQLLLATAVLTAVGFASVAVHAAPAAQALCAGPIKPGTWTSVKPEIHWITKIHLTFNCDDTVYVGCSNDSDASNSNPQPSRRGPSASGVVIPTTAIGARWSARKRRRVPCGQGLTASASLGISAYGGPLANRTSSR